MPKTLQKIQQISPEGALRLIALATIVALAAALRFANLEALGYANHYYAAAVTSMLKSWHNFFFVAAEPGGSVTVDKPPLGFWLQALSAYFLGVNGFSLLLPQLLAGILSVIVLYYLVRRSFGTVAGLLAALALAITPVVVATDRNNTIDSSLILILLLAAWAFSKATESGKLHHLLLGATLVGLGFNVKMLQAFLPLPAFCALYFLGSGERLWRKAWKLALATVLLLVVSLSWGVAVDLTPADQRPYVGSSGDNSEMNLIIGYNGLSRLLGRGGLASGPRRGNAPAARPMQDGAFPPSGLQADDGVPPPGAPDGNPGALPPQGWPDGSFPPLGAPGPNRGQFRGAPGGAGGAFGSTGKPGALRLFIPPLSKEVSWLLPCGLAGALLLLVGARLRWPLAPAHQALVLWGGWLLTGGVFFSIARQFHEYYLSMLAPPLAALVAIAVVRLWRLRWRSQRLAAALLLAIAGATLAFQGYTARAFTTDLAWLPLVYTLFAVGACLLVAATIRKTSSLALAGFTCVVVSILVIPGIWAGLTTMNASANQSLPSAYSGNPSGPANRGGLQVNQALLDFLEAHTQDVTYLMAVPSSMQGADYVLATGRPVLYMGGFMGQDQVITAGDLEQMVLQGELRYIYWNGREGRVGSQNEISTWVASACTPVAGFETTTRNVGAPDGTTPGLDASTNSQYGRAAPGQGDMQVSLYECGS